MDDAGRFVAFSSRATNLVENDTNGVDDVFVLDLQTGQFARVSVSGTGVQADGPSCCPFVSADGRILAFESQATNLVEADTNNELDIFWIRNALIQ